MKARKACKKMKAREARKEMKARTKHRHIGTQAHNAREHVKHVG